MELESRWVSLSFRQTHRNKLIAGHDNAANAKLWKLNTAAEARTDGTVQMIFKPILSCQRSCHVSSFHLTSSFLLSKRNRAAISDSLWSEIFPGFLGPLRARSGRLNRGRCFDLGPRCSSGLAKDATSRGVGLWFRTGIPKATKLSV